MNNKEVIDKGEQGKLMMVISIATSSVNKDESDDFQDWFLDIYKDVINLLKNVKDFTYACLTSYKIIHLWDFDDRDAQRKLGCPTKESKKIESVIIDMPLISAIIYSPVSDSFYIYLNDAKFAKYFAERIPKYFIGFTKNPYESRFNVSLDFIDDSEMVVVEINFDNPDTKRNNLLKSMSYVSLQQSQIIS